MPDFLGLSSASSSSWQVGLSAVVFTFIASISTPKLDEIILSFTGFLFVVVDVFVGILNRVEG